MDEKTSQLFVSVDPNIGKLAKEQEEIINEIDKPEEQKLENLPSTEEDVFDKAKPKPRGRKKKEGLRPLTTPMPVLKSIEEASPGGATPLEEEPVAPEKKLTAKQIAAQEKKKLKEAEAEAKRIAREDKRQAGIERNRASARERYRRLASEKKKAKDEEDKQIRKQIVKDTKTIDRIPTKNSNNEFTFDKFASYMLQYEGLKLQYAEQQQRRKQMEEKSKPKPKPKPEPKPQARYNPENYPLSGFYDPRNKYKNNFPHNNFY